MVATPHLPYPAPIESYGKGGFRFADMSHRGSLLCLPAGIWAWPVSTPGEITADTLAPVLTGTGVSFFLIGTGASSWTMPEPLRRSFREKGITVETALTGRAIPTYNILLGEGRPVGAGLIAVE